MSEDDIYEIRSAFFNFIAELMPDYASFILKDTSGSKSTNSLAHEVKAFDR